MLLLRTQLALQSHPFLKFRSKIPQLFPFLLRLPSPAMSSGRTVADVLMGNARRAAQKKSSPNPSPTAPDPKPEPPENPSPSKKPKTLDPLDKDKPKDLSLQLKMKGPDFNPRSAATWKDGDPVPFLFLARALELISNESGRIVITDILANVFRTVIATTPGDLLSTVYLSANRIAPPHEGLELGIGDASLIKALAEAYGRREEQVKKQLKVRKCGCFWVCFSNS